MREQLRKVQRGIENLLARAVLTGLRTASARQAAQVEMLADEAKDDLELLEAYGFTSAPLDGAEGLAVFPDGDRSHGLLLLVGDYRYRVKLSRGEVAIYSDEGDYVWLKRGRVVEVNTSTLLVKASTKVRFETPLVEASGDVRDARGTMQGMRDTFNTHTQAISGGTAQAPGTKMT